MIDNCLLERWGQPVCRGDVEREEGRVGRRVEMCWEESRWFGHDGGRETLPQSAKQHTVAMQSTRAFSREEREREEREGDRKVICVRGNGH